MFAHITHNSRAQAGKARSTTVRPKRTSSAEASRKTTAYKNKKPAFALRALAGEGGEGGIRTLDTSLSSYNGLANRPFRPLRHLSGSSFQKEISLLFRLAKIKINCKPASFYPIPARKTRLPKQYFSIKNSF